MSAEIKQRRKGYYGILEKPQKGDLGGTEWLAWFLDCLDHFPGRERIGARSGKGAVLGGTPG